MLSDHDRSYRSTSAVSDKARKTVDSLRRTIKTSMDVKKQYDDTIKSLDNTCRAKLKDLHFELKKENDIENKVKNNAGKPLNYFKLPQMLTRP